MKKNEGLIINTDNDGKKLREEKILYKEQSEKNRELKASPTLVFYFNFNTSLIWGNARIHITLTSHE